MYCKAPSAGYNEIRAEQVLNYSIITFLFCSGVYFCLYGLLNSISFQSISRQLSVFSLSSSGLISLPCPFNFGMYLFMTVSFNSATIPSG